MTDAYASSQLDTEYKQVSVGKFQGKTLINIREYYKDKTNGDLKPGKKVLLSCTITQPHVMTDGPIQGIALNVESFKSLLNVIPAIKQALIDQGEDLGELASDDETTRITTKVVPKKEIKEKKSNIEDTSDEDDN